MLLLVMNARYEVKYTFWTVRGQHQMCAQPLHNLLVV